MMVARWHSRRQNGSFRQHCLRMIAKLDLGPDVDVYDLSAQLSDLRGRPLRLVPFELPANAPEGFLVATGQEDFVVFEKQAVPVHQQQIILHELGHVLFEHDTETVLAEDAIALLMPSLDPALVQRILGREHTDSIAEQEAELSGTLIAERISAWTVQRTWPVPPEDEALVERLVRALGQTRIEGQR
jgi:hypothetical protein